MGPLLILPMEHGHLRRCHEKQRQAERALRNNKREQAKRLYLEASGECAQAAEDKEISEEVRQILSLLQLDCQRKAYYAKQLHQQSTPPKIRHFSARSVSLGQVSSVGSDPLHGDKGQPLEGLDHISQAKMGKHQVDSARTKTSSATDYNAGNDHGNLYWDLWDVLDKIVKRIPTPSRLIHTKSPHDADESFFIVPPNVQSTYDRSRIQVPEDDGRLAAAALRRAAQKYMDLNRNLHRIMSAGSGIQFVGKAEYDLERLQHIEQNCIQSMSSMSPDATKEIWIKLAIVLSEQVFLLLQENAHLHSKVEEHELLRKSLINFRRDAEVQQARVKQSMVLASSSVQGMLTVPSTNELSRHGLQSMSSAAATSPVVRQKSSRSEIEKEMQKLKLENDKLKTENANYQAKWETLREAAKKRKKKTVDERTA